MKTYNAYGLLIVAALAGCRSGDSPDPHLEVISGKIRGGEAAQREAYRQMREAESLAPTKANLPRIIDAERRALAVLPDPIAEARLARLLAQNGQRGEARAVYRALQAKVASGQEGFYTNDPSLSLEIADTAADLGMRGTSEAALAGLAAEPVHQIDARFRLPELDRVPSHARANGLFAAGIGMLRVHRNAEAVPLFERAVRERPGWGVARFMLAYAHAYAGHKAEADRAFADAARHGWKRPQGL